MNKVSMFGARKAGNRTRKESLMWQTCPAQNHLSSGLSNKPQPVLLSSIHVARETADPPQSLENEFLQTHNCIYQAWPRQPNTQFLTEQLQSIQILWIKWEKSPLSRAWLHFQKEPSQLYKAVLIFTLLYKLFQFSQLHVMALGKRLPQIPGRVSVQAPHASEQAWQSHTDTQMGRAEFSV